VACGEGESRFCTDQGRIDGEREKKAGDAKVLGNRGGRAEEATVKKLVPVDPSPDGVGPET
jgi:hypothetical protein